MDIYFYFEAIAYELTSIYLADQPALDKILKGWTDRAFGLEMSKTGPGEILAQLKDEFKCVQCRDCHQFSYGKCYHCNWKEA